MILVHYVCFFSHDVIEFHTCFIFQIVFYFVYLSCAYFIIIINDKHYIGITMELDNDKNVDAVCI